MTPGDGSWTDLSWRGLSLFGRLVLHQARQHPWATAVALYGLARAFGVVVQSGQRGVLFRFGRVVKELEPGFHWLVPGIHGVRSTPVRSTTIQLDRQRILTADGLVYDVEVNVVYRVDDATRALTRVDQVDVGCRNALPLLVTEVVRTRGQGQLLDRETLDHELTARIQAWVGRWGLTIEQAGFTTIAPSRVVLPTTQLRFKVEERARSLDALRRGGLDPETALILVGSERRPVAATRLAYRRSTLRPTRPSSAPRPRRAAARPAAEATTTTTTTGTATTPPTAGGQPAG